MSENVASAPDGVAAEPGEFPSHRIALAIDRFIHRVRDIKTAARLSIPAAAKISAQQIRQVVQQLEHAKQLLGNDDNAKRGIGIREANSAMLRFDRLRKSSVPAVIETGLYLALFSAYDAFTGELLEALFERKPELFNALTKTLSFAEVLSATSVDELKRSVLLDDIEQFRRKSYMDQFGFLEQRFDLKLTAFDRWASFVECAQRRNVLTHCDGIVSEQYVKACSAAGYPIDKIANVGDKLALGSRYFFDSCELLIEVGFKLGQTLWRKTLSMELEMADKHLRGVLYSFLEYKLWNRAEMVGAFGMSLRHRQLDRDKRILVVNYVQSLKFGAEPARAEEILGQFDWSATIIDFRLAEAVLLDRYDDAAEIMRRIGKKGDLITEQGYQTWPLFFQFRESEQFAKAYQDVYGHAYIATVEEATAQKHAAAERDVAHLAAAAEDAAITVRATGDLSASRADDESMLESGDTAGGAELRA